MLVKPKRIPTISMKIFAIACLSISTLFAQTTDNSPAAVELVRLKFGGGADWYNGPTELPNLAAFAKSNAGIAAFSTGRFVEPASPEIFSFPFIFMCGHGNVFFTDREAANLRKYLENGGFLLVNDDYGLDAAFRREMRKVFPDKEFVELPFDHSVYHYFFDFPAGLPKIHEHDNKPPQGFGIFVEGRLVVFYAYESDIADGWDDPSVHGDPEEKRTQALRMGTNILFFALTN